MPSKLSWISSSTDGQDFIAPSASPLTKPTHISPSAKKLWATPAITLASQSSKDCMVNCSM
jgi:hypothetical protein